MKACGRSRTASAPRKRRASFDGEFVELARAVYRHNDKRAALKREINLLLKSDFVEEKQYTPYG